MVYVGANDGMLHAFDEAAGTEVWAYVPSFAFDATPDKGLAMLAKKEPFFKHQMFVDSTPVVADVDIGGTWKTVLVGGLGKGGKGYYAIDVTAPSGVADEADAAANVLWEFSDTELGYSHGKPLIAKTYADGWVAILPSGHNSGGKGKLFFVSLADGTLLRTLETTVGSAGTPSGLSQVSGFVLSYKNQYARADLRRRPAGQRLALRRVEQGPGRLEGREVRRTHQHRRHRAIGHRRAADRGGLRQRRRPLRHGRHGAAAARGRPRRLRRAGPDDVRDPRRDRAQDELGRPAAQAAVRRRLLRS